MAWWREKLSFHKSGELNSCFTHILKFAFPCYQVLDCVINMKLFRCELNANVEERKKREGRGGKKRSPQLRRIIKKSASQKSQENGNVQWNRKEPFSLCASFYPSPKSAVKWTRDISERGS